MDDPRLYICPNCGNQQLLFPADQECDYCEHPVSRPESTGLSESDKALFTNRVASLMSYFGACVKTKGLDIKASEAMVACVGSLCELVGISVGDVAEAMLSLNRSKDQDKWLKHMT